MLWNCEFRFWVQEFFFTESESVETGAGIIVVPAVSDGASELK
jgi:hypothetical protein